jgi:5-methylthioadenosine/S-adenosylhomocysteine deaminase
MMDCILLGNPSNFGANKVLGSRYQGSSIAFIFLMRTVHHHFSLQRKQMSHTFFADQVMSAPGARPPLGPCAIEVGHGKITAITQLQARPPQLPQTPPLIALPAPSNAHDHGRGLRTLGFGAIDSTLETWLPALQREPLIDPYLRAVTAFARMLEGGICATNHCHNTQDGKQLLAEAQGVARAAREVGIRVAFAVPFAGRNTFVYGELPGLLERLPKARWPALIAARTPSRTLAENLALMEQIAALEHECFEVQYGPVGPQWVDEDSLRAIATASAHDGRRIHMHLFETRRQREWADAHYRHGLLRHLESIGLLSARLTLAHCIWLSADDCRLLASYGVSVALNTSSNLRLQSGMASLQTMLDTGLKFGIGLDGMSLDDDDDMLREIRLLWHLQRGGLQAEGLTAARLFQAACIDGRRSITRCNGGVIEVGAAADFLLLDSRRILADQLDDTCENFLPLLLGRMRKEDIYQLIVAGRIVAERGHCTGIDRPALEHAMYDQARQYRTTHPVDNNAIGELQHAVADYYRCSCHSTGNKNNNN